MARKTRSFLDNTSTETDDFGDLGPVIPADEKPAEPEPIVAPVLAPKPVKKVEKIILKAEDILAAIVGGDTSGLPLRKGSNPKQTGKEIVLAQSTSTITAAIAGQAVDCVLVHETRLSSWKVRGKAQELSGKYRLENEVRIVMNGQILTLKKGKEFYDHQLPVALVRQAGGIVLPIGTQE